MGMRAIDVGHMDIEYEWFLNGARDHELISGKFTNEAPNGDQVQDCKDSEYLKQVVKRINC